MFSFIYFLIFYRKNPCNPPFNVEENGTFVLVALARHCKETKTVFDQLTGREEIKSAAVFTPIIEFTPVAFAVTTDIQYIIDF